MNKRLLLVIPVLVVAAVVVVLAWPRGGTPVKREQAVDEFRRSASTERPDGSRDPGEANASERDESQGTAGSIPPVGVYTYAAKGQEEVKLGPFPADTRVLAPEVVASVTASSEQSPPGGTAQGAADEAKCFDYELNLFAEHIERTTYCLDGAGSNLSMEAHTKRLKIGPATPTASLACSPKLVLSAGADARDIPCNLTLSGGPMEVKAEMLADLKVSAPENLSVEGESVQVRLVKVDYVATGRVAGTWSESIWMREADWLPVRIIRQINLSGPASIKETSELTLESLQPTT